MFHQMYMQQNKVISELVEYANSVPVPDNVASVKIVVEYLEALYKLEYHVQIFKLTGSTTLCKKNEKGFNS